MTKVCFTAIFGSIDDLHEPTVVTDGWRYVCITDRTDIKSDVYEIVKVKHNFDKRAFNRQIKMQEFNHVDVKLYHDGCFRVNCDLDVLPDSFMVKHPLHDCAYKELDLCYQLGKIDYLKWVQLKAHLNSLQIEANEGMFCGGLWKFTNPNIEFFNEWYSYQNYSVRDQWILPYLLKKNEIQFDSITWQEAIKLLKWEKHVGK